MRVPVVCADAQGLAENVADRVTGFVVARRNPTALAERLARLAASPELRDRMGKAGRRRVLSQFTLARAIDGYDRLYRDVLGVSEPPPKSG
jgi:glycosyltransferase involved in cell wall biosynthesis